MRIIFLGAPGSGKGTQAQFISNKYQIPQISTGEMLRTEIQKNSSLGKRVKKIIESGMLVNDEIIISLIKKRILQKDCQFGFLFDGFPRTINQAKAIKKENINIDYIFQFLISEHLILERISGRRVHLPSGRTYHIKFSPPYKNNLDNITGEKLTIRKDDSKNIIKKRLNQYYYTTIPIIKYYIEEKKLGNIQYYTIDATLPIEQIKKKITTILN